LLRECFLARAVKEREKSVCGDQVPANFPREQKHKRICPFYEYVIYKTYSEKLLDLEAAPKYTQSSPAAVRDAADSRETTLVRPGSLPPRFSIEDLNACFARRTTKSEEVSA
jgi:hypothetical protein